jgi:hypothetical protein
MGGRACGRLRYRRATPSQQTSPSSTIDRFTIECHKSPASEAPNPGRHHPGMPGDIISERLGDFVGIRKKMSIRPPTIETTPEIATAAA